MQLAEETSTAQAWLRQATLVSNRRMRVSATVVADSSAGGPGRPGRARWRSRTEYDYLLKLVLVGDEGTGKSSLMSRFCDSSFSPSYVATIGVDFKVRSVIVNTDDGATCTVKMQLWDTAGQERFSSITSSFYRGADAVFVMYDITSIDSFRKIHKWLKGCTDVCGTDLPGVLVGNKCDLERHREVPVGQGGEMATTLGMPHFETSAKLGTNVDEVFRQVATQYATKCRATQSAARSSARPRQNGNARGGQVVNPGPDDVDPGCLGWLARLFSWRRRSPTRSSDGSINGGGGDARSKRPHVLTPPKM